MSEPLARIDPALTYHLVNTLGWTTLRPLQRDAIDPVLRGDDVLLLAEHFLDRFRAEFHKPSLRLPPETKTTLRAYAWPGNVRELQNAIERAAILAAGPDIDERALQLPEARRAPEQMPEGMLAEEFLWEGPLEEVSQRAASHVERFKIQTALREAKWNKTRAAEKLGVSYKTLLNKIRTLGLEN